MYRSRANNGLSGQIRYDNFFCGKRCKEKRKLRDAERQADVVAQNATTKAMMAMATDPKPTKSNDRNTWLIVGGIGSAAVVIGIGVFIWHKNKTATLVAAK